MFRRRMETFPILTTERLNLRALAAGDAEAVRALYGQAEVTQYSELVTLGDADQAALVIRQFQGEFERGTGIRWAVALKTSPRLIGTCGLAWHRQNFSTLLSYDLAPEFWNQGIMTEAAREVVRYCFERTDTNRISATTTLANAASMRLLHKLGFQEEGILRQWAFWKGKFVDLRCFSLLKQDGLPK
jgi:ribosomal-protein-alanine N-acetyltransferase